MSELKQVCEEFYKLTGTVSPHERLTGIFSMLSHMGATVYYSTVAGKNDYVVEIVRDAERYRVVMGRDYTVLGVEERWDWNQV